MAVCFRSVEKVRVLGIYDLDTAAMASSRAPSAHMRRLRGNNVTEVSDQNEKCTHMDCRDTDTVHLTETPPAQTHLGHKPQAHFICT